MTPEFSVELIKTMMFQAVTLAAPILLTVLAPGLWLEPFGALLKNLPILALIGVWMVLEEER